MEDLILISVSKHELKGIIESSVFAALNKEKPHSEKVEKNSEILNIEGASEFLSLAKPTIYTLTSKSKIPFFKKGKKLYFKRSELLEWIEQGKQKTVAEEQQEMDEYLLRKSKNL
jgi:excisionase family DNA binding protein